MARMAAVANSNTGNPGFSGYLGSYYWYWLDLSGGGPINASTVNTSLIDNDLAELASLSAVYGVDFKLIIQLRVGSYTSVPKSCPPTPQPVPYTPEAASYAHGVLPDYIINGVSGKGTDCLLGPNNLGIAAAIFRPAVMARWVQILQFLGSKYDSNPHVEMIIPIGESAQNPGTPPSDYTEPQYNAAIRSMITAVSATWPTTNKIFPNNFYPPGSNLSDLLANSQFAAASGFGFGGPDMTNPPYLAVTEGSLIIEGAGNSSADGFETGFFGNTDYRGLVPLMMQQQQGAYIPGTTPAQFEAYEYNTLQLTHPVWEYDPGPLMNGSAAMYFPSLSSYLQSVNFRVHSACPTNYVQGCNTN
jgi:hypothetical protein